MEKLLLDPFLKNQNLAYRWINSPKFYGDCIYCMPNCGLLRYIETNMQTTLPHIKLFLKNRGLELVLLPNFLCHFRRKIFFSLHSFNWPNLLVWLPLLREILGNLCIEIVY